MREPFKTFERTIMINGHEVNAQVRIFVDEDQDTRIEDDYDNGTPEEIEAYRARFHFGELFIACIGVEASYLGETDSDCLGGCHIHTNNYFDSKPFEADVEQMITSHNMIQNALDLLENSLRAKATLLFPFADQNKTLGGAK